MVWIPITLYWLDTQVVNLVHLIDNPHPRGLGPKQSTKSKSLPLKKATDPNSLVSQGQSMDFPFKHEKNIKFFKYIIILSVRQVCLDFQFE